MAVGSSIYAGDQQLNDPSGIQPVHAIWDLTSLCGEGKLQWMFGHYRGLAQNWR